MKNRLFPNYRRYQRRFDLISRYKIQHAPEGGITVGGKPFVGGEFIPDAALANASPQEVQALETGQGGQQPAAPTSGAMESGGAEQAPEQGTPEDLQMITETATAELANAPPVLTGIIKALQLSPEFKNTGTVTSQPVHPKQAEQIHKWMQVNTGPGKQGQVVRMSANKYGFASKAGSLVVQKIADGEYNVAYTANTGIVRGAQKPTGRPLLPQGQRRGPHAPSGATPGGGPGSAPGSPQPTPKPAPKPKKLSAIRQAVQEAAADFGISADDLMMAVDEVWQLRRDFVVRNESLKKELRKTTGLTARDINRMEDQGKDWGHNDVTSRGFDTTAESYAEEYPELGIDPDNAEEGTWNLIKEGRQFPPPKNSPDLIDEAAELVQRSSSEPELDREMAAVPFARAATVKRDFYRRLYARQQSFDWSDEDEQKHPRDADGKFSAKPEEGAKSESDGKTRAKSEIDGGQTGVSTESGGVLDLRGSELHAAIMGTRRTEATGTLKDLDDYGEHKHELDLLNYADEDVKVGYLKARAAGLDHDLAMKFADGLEDGKDDAPFLSEHLGEPESLGDVESPKGPETPAESEGTSETAPETPEDVEPDAPEAEGEEETPELGKAIEAPIGTPRGDAEQQTVADLEGDEYDFARSSAYSNLGADVTGSARHRANAWRTLAEAEADGTAEKMVVRKELLRNEPHNLAMADDKHTLTALAMHYTLNAFPLSPIPKGRGYAKLTEDDRKKAREQYVESYRMLKMEAETLAKLQADPHQAVTKMRDILSIRIEELRGGKGLTAKDKYNPVANALVTTYKAAYWQAWGKPKKNTVQGKISEFTVNVAKKHGGELPEGGDKMAAFIGHAKEHSLDIMAGKSMSATFGITSEGKQSRRVNPADFYVKHATRKGGTPAATDYGKAGQQIIGKAKFKGLQWGQWVSDDERREHANYVSGALIDLADVVGLPISAISGEGHLSLAVGARGHSAALAHYEPQAAQPVINLTRKAGVGAFAHEWGHFFDHQVNELATGSFGSDGYRGPMGANAEAMKEPYNQWKQASQKFRGRLSKVIGSQFNFMTPEKKRYWKSDIEVFARTFEVHVKQRLASEGRENTYLSGIASEDLWPNAEESAEMAPAFDAIFDAWRAHKYPDQTPEQVREDNAKYRRALRIADYARKHKPAANQGGFNWGAEDEAKHPRDDGGKFASKPGGGAAADDDEPFTLKNDPVKKKPADFGSQKTKQGQLLSGLDSLPGQQDLFADMDQMTDSIGAQEAQAEQPAAGSRAALMASYPIFQPGGDVDGRRVLADIPNLSSISSSVEHPEEMPGVRIVDTSLFESWDAPGLGYASADDNERVRQLAAAIKASGKIKPLVVIVDDKGPYVLEGGHRYEALRLLGAKSFPAKVVIDRGSLPDPVAKYSLRQWCAKYAKHTPGPGQQSFDWTEDKHPRDDGGKFSTKPGGGGSRVDDEAAVAEEELRGDSPEWTKTKTQQMHERLEAHRQAAVDNLAANVQKAGNASAVKLVSGKGRGIELFIHPSAKKPGIWQLSQSDERGPIGDREFDSFELALQNASGVTKPELFASLIGSKDYKVVEAAGDRTAQQAPPPEKKKERPRDLDDDELSRKSFNRNWEEVSADPMAASDVNLRRAESYLIGLMSHYDREYQRGDMTLLEWGDQKRNIQPEQEWYRDILRRREKGELDSPQHRTETESVAHEAVTTNSSIWTVMKNRGFSMQERKEYAPQVSGHVEQMRGAEAQQKAPSAARKRAQESQQARGYSRAAGEALAMYGAKHAPKGGIAIGGKRYKGGAFIPAEVIENADPSEKAALGEGPEIEPLGRDSFGYTEDPGEVSDTYSCQTCIFFADRCELFSRLTAEHPRIFKLDDEVSPHGTCNSHRQEGDGDAALT